MCFAQQRRALFSTSQLLNVVRRWCALYISTWKCASRHNGVHFFVISTSKTGPNMRCFEHFDLEMCFAPQTACTFLTSQLPKVVRPWCFVHFDLEMCSAHFFDISTSKRAPKLKCFVHFDLDMHFAPQRRAIFHLSSGQLALHPPL